VKGARWGAIVFSATVLAGCEACIENLEDVTWDDAAASGAGGAGGGSPGVGGATGGAGGEANVGAGGAGGGCAAPSWSGKAPDDDGPVAGCESGILTTPEERFLGCPDCKLSSDTYDISFDHGWAPYCGFLRGEDTYGDIQIEFGQAMLSSSCSTWAHQGYAPLLYRTVSLQDFVVVTHVRVEGVGGNPPTKYGHGGGLMVRLDSWPPGATTEEEYLRLSAAYKNATDEVGVFFRRKSTTLAPLEVFHEADHTAYDLAFCRKDGVLQAWFRGASDPWAQLGEDQTLPPLQDEVQVGVEVHAYQGGEIARARFDALLFDEVPAAADCGGAVMQLARKLPAPQE
jgi:hypothetical protein